MNRRPDSWLIVGADGLLGRALFRHLEGPGRRVLATTRRAESAGPGRPRLELDAGALSWRPPWPVRCALLLAAQGSLAACREDPAATRRINVERTCALARVLAREGAFVVLPSTDLVFSGEQPQVRADARRQPRTEYGRQKAAAEDGVLALGARSAVVRLGKVLAPGLPLWRGWMASLRRSEAIHPFSDRRLAPLSLDLAVRLLAAVADKESPGVFQLTARSSVTYAEAAGHLARRLGAPAALVQPVEAARALGEPGPAQVTLDGARAEAELGLTAPDPFAAIDALL